MNNFIQSKKPNKVFIIFIHFIFLLLNIKDLGRAPFETFDKDRHTNIVVEECIINSSLMDYLIATKCCTSYFSLVSIGQAPVTTLFNITT